MRRNEQTSWIVKSIAWYCQKSPVKFGKAKLRMFGLRSLGVTEVLTTSNDGIQFLLHMPEDSSWFSIYYDGNFETGTLEVLKRIVKSDDIILDIGANIGWYTTHISRLIPKGHCHAFEPVPSIFAKLKKHCEINNVQGNVTLNMLALGDKVGSVELHTFPDLPHGHSSISSLGRSTYDVSLAEMIPLDMYLTKNSLNKVDIIKIDVEGAEALVLEGAERLLQMSDPPIWVIELNKETSAVFGHTPSDLLKTLTAYGEYDFYRVVAGWGGCKPMATIYDYEHGDNAICVPKSKIERMKDF